MAAQHAAAGSQEAAGSMQRAAVSQTQTRPARRSNRLSRPGGLVRPDADPEINAKFRVEWLRRREQAMRREREHMTPPTPPSLPPTPAPPDASPSSPQTPRAPSLGTTHNTSLSRSAPPVSLPAAAVLTPSARGPPCQNTGEAKSAADWAQEDA